MSHSISGLKLKHFPRMDDHGSPSLPKQMWQRWWQRRRRQRRLQSLFCLGVATDAHSDGYSLCDENWDIMRHRPFHSYHMEGSIVLWASLAAPENNETHCLDQAFAVYCSWWLMGAITSRLLDLMAMMKCEQVTVAVLRNQSHFCCAACGWWELWSRVMNWAILPCKVME